MVFLRDAELTDYPPPAPTVKETFFIYFKIVLKIGMILTRDINFFKINNFKQIALPGAAKKLKGLCITVAVEV